jgi:hypothetical protein
MSRNVHLRISSFAAILTALWSLCAVAQAADVVRGAVQGGGAPIVNATVTLWEAGAGAPKQLAQAKSDARGQFVLQRNVARPDTILYVVALGGEPKAKAGAAQPAIGLLSVIGAKPPSTIVVNELTTVASAFTAARFINGTSISGNPLGLRIAAGNAPNLVDPATGKWGKVVLDPINITQTTTLAKLNTLASLITASFTVADDNWRARFFKASTPIGGATPTNTLEAIAGIARASWTSAKDIFALFDEAYPQPKDGARRNAAFLPYLGFAPPDYALMLCFAGGGYYAGGKFMFDADGNMWSGQNWMPGAQNTVLNSIGGGTVKFAPNGTALSPPVTGFRGMGVDGVGWGTGVDREKVWVTSFNGKIGVMDFNGRPIGKESDFPMAGKVGGLQAVGIAANGDVWIPDATRNQLLYFPGGKVKEGRLVQVEGLKSPFGVVIDNQNRVWVSNAQSDTVVRFSANDPSKVESFRAGIGVRGIALDSKGNLWVASNMSLDFPPPKIPDGVSILKQFELAGDHLMKLLTPGKTTGVVNMIRPDGTQPAPMGYTGNGKINVAWGVSIDGNDDVWVANFWGRGVVLMAGADPKGHTTGTKSGDVVHQFQGGSIQMLTDVVVDPAGNVWAANNWNVPQAVLGDPPPYPVSTWGGGSGLTIIYGVAAPVQAPLMGPARAY